MIRRLVRLTFKTGSELIFLNEILPKQKHFTRNFDGCEHLELWQALNEPNIVFSFSIWQSEEKLNNYRHSAKFKTFWSSTKELFSEKPYAISLNQLQVVEQKTTL